MENTKSKQITAFLAQLSQEHSETKYPFTVICNKCGSNECIIYHGCECYFYSEYTNGFEDNCGLKCKGCGNAAQIHTA